MMKFKTLKDIDFVMQFQNGNVKMPLLNMVGEPCMELFQDIHLIHLMNINSTKGIVPFNIDFKRFLSEQTGFSIRKIEYAVKKLIEAENIIKDNRVYTLTEDFRKMFKISKIKRSEMPWADRPNYK